MPIWKSKAAQYWLLAIASTITFTSFVAFHSLDSSSLARIKDFQIDGIASQHGNTAVFELEGVGIAQPFPDYPEASNDASKLEWLLTTLDTRIKILSDSSDTPACPLNLERFSTVLKPSYRSRKAHPISFAINLRNSQHILPALMKAILTTIHHILPNHAVYLSIYENDSDDTTSRMLAHFASALQRMGVDGIWITSSNLHSSINVENRINVLAELRNAALRPLLPFAKQGTLIFINDVILCAADILELIMQSRMQSADIALGVDWADALPATRVPWVYDTWVLRGINGQMVYEQSKTDPLPVNPPPGRDWLTHAFSTQSTDIHERWLNNLPFPVYGGWGGIVALRADLFTQDGLRFRSTKATGWSGGSASGSMGAWGKLVTEPSYMKSDCPGDSECGLAMRDVWNIRKGRARIVLATQVNTAYSMGDWKKAQLMLPFVPRSNKVTSEELIDWSNVTIPRGVMCMPTRTDSGKAHDAHDGRLFRYLTLDPLFEPTSTPAAVAYSR